MPFIFSYWYMFFFCVGIATVAMSAGIGGATFFVPFILLVLKVPIRSAIAIGIFVEIFGFAAGVYNYMKRGQIDFSLARKTLYAAVPMVVAGVFLNHFIHPTVVEYIFILALMIFATQLLLYQRPAPGDGKDFDVASGFISGLGGLLLGFLSSGLGESNEYDFFVHLGYSPAATAATSVSVVAVSAIIATAAQVYFIIRGPGFGTITPYTMLIIYSILGAVVGAKFGAIMANKVDRDKFRKLISILLYAVAVVSIIKVIFIAS